MINENCISKAEELAGGFVQQGDRKVKYLRKEQGLIERSLDDDKVILAEDNRQVLFG